MSKRVIFTNHKLMLEIKADIINKLEFKVNRSVIRFP